VRENSHFSGSEALELSKVNRSCILVASEYKIECAVRADGTSPAREFLDLLRTGMWDGDPEVEEVPDDEQVRDYHRLVANMSYLARNGEPERQRDIRYLTNGLWEFAVYTKRLVFYDTDGAGAYTPKPRITTRSLSPHPDTDFWWFPDMDYTLRLANFWPKIGEQADPLDIQEALKIREEDLRHDREQ
jgi:hypothetical protein